MYTKGISILALSELLIAILKTVTDLVAGSNLLPKARNTARLLTDRKHGSQFPSHIQLQHQGELPPILAIFIILKVIPAKSLPCLRFRV